VVVVGGWRRRQKSKLIYVYRWNTFRSMCDFPYECNGSDLFVLDGSRMMGSIGFWGKKRGVRLSGGCGGEWRYLYMYI